MAAYSSTLPTTQYESYNAGVIPIDVFGVAINWFVNRTPLTSRLPKLPVSSPKFSVTSDAYRPRTGSLTADATNSATTITVADATQFTAGDVVQIESEYVLVSAVASTTTLTVVRGYAGSTGAAHTAGAGLPVYLISNTRTGAEVDQAALSRIPAVADQWCQTVQHPYQVGGALQADTDYVSGVAPTPLDRDRMLALQHAMDDFESAVYYGPGVSLSGVAVRPMMTGLQTLIPSGNRTTSPSDAAAYKPSSLVRDTIQKCFDNGGNPNLLVVSTDFLTGMAVWGHAAMRIPAGANVFGTPIDLFETPFVSGVSIVPAPLLRAGTAICLSASEIRIRLKRNLFDKPRGSRGDAFEGDMIMEGAVELDNPSHHAWLSGVTTFAAES